MKIFITIISFLIPFLLMAQTNKGTFKVRKHKVRTEYEVDTLRQNFRTTGFITKDEFNRTVTRPMYPGGKKAMLKYISNNLIFPPNEKIKKITGTVQIGFSIDVGGTLSEITILEGQGKLKNEEAFRIVRLMPKWIPKKINGFNVKSTHSILIKFTLK